MGKILVQDCLHSWLHKILCGLCFSMPHAEILRANANAPDSARAASTRIATNRDKRMRQEDHDRLKGLPPITKPPGGRTFLQMDLWVEERAQEHLENAMQRAMAVDA